MQLKRRKDQTHRVQSLWDTKNSLYISMIHNILNCIWACTRNYTVRSQNRTHRLGMIHLDLQILTKSVIQGNRDIWIRWTGKIHNQPLWSVYKIKSNGSSLFHERPDNGIIFTVIKYFTIWQLLAEYAGP